jgi:cystathionine beta-synthase
MVVMLPDSIRNYLSRFINDPWMIDSGYMLPKPETLAGQDRTVGELQLPQIVAISPETTLAESLERMTTLGFNQLPVVDNGKVIGGVSVDHINTKLMHKLATTTTPVKQFLIPDVKVVAPDYPIQRLFMAFVVRGFVFVKDGDTYFIATPVDLAKFLVSNSSAS